MDAGKAAAIAGFGMVNVSTGAKSDILQKAVVKVSGFSYIPQGQGLSEIRQVQEQLPLRN
jgi:hypothetical protein